MKKKFQNQEFYTLTEDITSLRNSFYAIYEKSTDGMIVMKGHKFRDFNPALIKMFGFDSKNELLNTHIKELMPKCQTNGKNSLKEMLRQANDTLKNEHNAFEWLFKRRDGSLFWCDIVLTKISVGSEDLIHGIYRDITEKKELEKIKENFKHDLEKRVKEEVEKNRQKERIMMQQSRLAQMGEMVSMIAHQWRQPLSAISALNSTMMLKAKLDKLCKTDAIKLSKDIEECIKHLNLTIDDFRDFFKDKKEKEEVALKEIVQKTIDIISVTLVRSNIELITQYNSDKKIKTYTNEIKQVVLNIIKNAEDALLENKIKNPKINIQTYDTKIIISDNAGGIPDDIIDKIFDPYFSTKTKKDGTGLGLYMSKTIIEEHCGGKLNVCHSNDGAVFTIMLESFVDD